MSSSSLERHTVRSPGGFNAAISKPWYFLVLIPRAVLDAYPPSPLVTIHSRCKVSLKRESASSLKAIAGKFILRHQLGNVFVTGSTKIVSDGYTFGSEKQQMRFCQFIFGEGFSVPHSFCE